MKTEIIILFIIVLLVIGFAALGYTKGFKDARETTIKHYGGYINESCMCVQRNYEEESSDYWNKKTKELKNISSLPFLEQ